MSRLDMAAMVAAPTGDDKVAAIIGLIQREADANATIAGLARTNEITKGMTISIADTWDARGAQCDALIKAIRRMV